MTTFDFTALSASQIHDGIVAGDFSAREIAEASIAAMEALVGDRRSAAGFRAVCALAVAVRALRFIARLLGAG